MRPGPSGGWESLRHAAGMRESLWRAAEGGPGGIAMTRCREAGGLASWKQEILPCGGRACGVRAGELAACGREAGKLEARCWEAGELAACGRRAYCMRTGGRSAALRLRVVSGSVVGGVVGIADVGDCGGLVGGGKEVSTFLLLKFKQGKQK